MRRIRPVGAVQRDEKGHSAVGANLEDAAEAICPAVGRSAVKSAIRPLHQARIGVDSGFIQRACKWVELHQDGDVATRSDLQDRARVCDSAISRRSIEVAIPRTYQTGC